MGKEILSDKLTRQIGSKSVLVIPILICLFLLATSVSVVFPSQQILDSKRLLQTAVIPFLFLLALINAPLRNAISALLTRTPKPIATILLVVFLLGCISSSRFLHPAYSFVEVGMLFNLVLAVFITASVRVMAGLQFDRLVLWSIAAIGAAVLLQEVMGLLASWSIGNELSYDGMFIYFAHPRFYNQFQTWSVPLIAALPSIFNASTRIRVITLLLLAGQWYLMIASGARGSIVSVTFAIMLIGALAYPVSRNWLKLNIGGALLGLGGYFVILLTQNILAEGTGQFLAQSLGRSLTHSTGRTWIWSFAWQDALHHPWLGAGPARFACNADAALPGHPHNTALQLFGEWGFPVTILILGLVMFLAWRLLKHVRTMRSESESGNNILKLCLIASMASAAIHSSVSGLLVMPASQMIAILSGGWLLGMLSQPVQSNQKSIRSNLLIIVGLGFSMAIATFGVIEIQKQEYRLGDFTEADFSKPRFWHEGRICRYRY